MKKALIIFNSAITAALVVVLCLNMYFVFAKTVLKNDMPRILGYSSAVVVSSSMSPAIETDDFVVLKQQANYSVGDIITYRSDKFVTHRIVEETEKGYITKGDSPTVIRDEEISREQVVGKVVKIIPKVGKLLNELKTPAGILAIVLIGAIIFEFPQFLDILKKRKEEESGHTMGGEACGNQ